MQRSRLCTQRSCRTAGPRCSTANYARSLRTVHALQSARERDPRSGFHPPRTSSTKRRFRIIAWVTTRIDAWSRASVSSHAIASRTRPRSLCDEPFSASASRAPCSPIANAHARSGSRIRPRSGGSRSSSRSSAEAMTSRSGANRRAESIARRASRASTSPASAVSRTNAGGGCESSRIPAASYATRQARTPFVSTHPEWVCAEGPWRTRTSLRLRQDASTREE